MAELYQCMFRLACQVGRHVGHCIQTDDVANVMFREQTHQLDTQTLRAALAGCPMSAAETAHLLLLLVSTPITERGSLDVHTLQKMVELAARPEVGKEIRDQWNLFCQATPATSKMYTFPDTQRPALAYEWFVGCGAGLFPALVAPRNGGLSVPVALLRNSLVVPSAQLVGWAPVRNTTEITACQLHNLRNGNFENRDYTKADGQRLREWTSLLRAYNPLYGCETSQVFADKLPHKVCQSLVRDKLTVAVDLRLGATALPSAFDIPTSDSVRHVSNVSPAVAANEYTLALVKFNIPCNVMKQVACDASEDFWNTYCPVVWGGDSASGFGNVQSRACTLTMYVLSVPKKCRMVTGINFHSQHFLFPSYNEECVFTGETESLPSRKRGRHEGRTYSTKFGARQAAQQYSATPYRIQNLCGAFLTNTVPEFIRIIAQHGTLSDRAYSPGKAYADEYQQHVARGFGSKRQRSMQSERRVAVAALGKLWNQRAYTFVEDVLTGWQIEQIQQWPGVCLACDGNAVCRNRSRFRVPPALIRCISKIAVLYKSELSSKPANYAVSKVCKVDEVGNILICQACTAAARAMCDDK